MADWNTNEDLALIAHRLGTAVTAMYEHAGFPINVPAYPGGAPSPDARQTFIDSFVADAQDFISVEPQKVLDEYIRMEREGSALHNLALGQHAPLETAHAIVTANWEGDAAIAFANHLADIGMFIAEQRDRILQAAQAMGTLYKLAIEARRSYHNLAENTIAACEREMADQDNRDTKADIGVLGEIVTAGINLFDVRRVGDLIGRGIEAFTEIGVKYVEISLEGSEAPEVVESYIRGRNQLRESFDDGLHELTKWIKGQDQNFRGLIIPILKPMPAELDITGPTFNYDMFEHEYRDPGTFGPRVERERVEMAEEKRKTGHTEIERRLGGDKGPA